jgi:transposase
MHPSQLFEAALGLTPPWQVDAVHFQPATATTRGRLELRINFARGGEFPCPECGAACPAYDTSEHEWRHLDFFQHETQLIARVPRVQCATHGVRTVAVPWARPGSGFTLLFEAFVLLLAAEMPMAALAELVNENDTRLWRLVQWHVRDARERVDMSEVTALVVDETSRAKRHHYVTLFLEPAAPAPAAESPVAIPPAEPMAPRVLYVAEGRSHDVFGEFATDLAAHGGTAAQVEDVCMDMSPAYQKGAAKTMPQAAITFDRFHVIKLVNTAVDDARRCEQRERPELKDSRYAWLVNPEHATVQQQEQLTRLSRLNLLTAKAYQMRLNLQGLWECTSEAAAARYLRRWCTWVLRVAKPPTDRHQPWVLQVMYKTAQTLRANVAGILNYFRKHLTSGVLESINGLAQAARARARGYRNVETYKTIIYLLAARLEFAVPELITHTG